MVRTCEHNPVGGGVPEQVADCRPFHCGGGRIPLLQQEKTRYQPAGFDRQTCADAAG